VEDAREPALRGLDAEEGAGEVEEDALDRHSMIVAYRDAGGPAAFRGTPVHPHVAPERADDGTAASGSSQAVVRA
jgi:hypothetical protein